MREIIITVNTASDMEAFTIKNALQSIAKNFNKDNLVYIAGLANKPKANERFNDLKSNPIVKALL